MTSRVHGFKQFTFKNIGEQSQMKEIDKIGIKGTVVTV